MHLDGLFTLLTFSIVMGLASYLAGWLPLSFTLSQKQSKVISSIGTGLLIGTCLIIIIPEGIGTLYSARDHEPTPDSVSPPSSPGDDRDIMMKRDEHDHHHANDPHAWVGLALVSGFIMMYLIDQLPRHAAKVSLRRKPLHVSLADLSSGLHRSGQASVDGIESEEDSGTASAKGFATTVGLVIHAAADGIALAASTFITQTSIGFIVFLALMIHKAPAAFGLTSVLLKQGLTKRQAKAHLIVFSLAAPIGAIITWSLVTLISGGKVDSEESTKFWTGLLLIFSGGTFLYVAMHTVQDSEHDNHDETNTNGYANGHAFAPSKGDGQGSELRDTLLAVAGMLLPLLAQVGHTH